MIQGTGPALSDKIKIDDIKIDETSSFILIHLNLIAGTLPLRPLTEALAWIGIVDNRLDTLRLDAESVQRALRCGLNAVQIADVIRRLTGTALTTAAFDQVTSWAAHADQVHIEHADLLYTSDPELLSTLYADRRVKPLLDKPISPHHAVIRVGKREQLNQQLQRRGYRAQSTQETPGEPADVPVKQAVAHDTASAAWLAMRVYQALGDLIPQALPIPGALSDELKAQLSLGQQDQLEQAAGQLVEQLRQAIRGQVSMLAPSPVAPNDPAAIRVAVEQAYRERQPITIEYFSPAQGRMTERTIEPLLPIRDEGDYSYVEAWCRLQNDSRTFRLDRIVRVINNEDNEYQFALKPDILGEFVARDFIKLESPYIAECS